ncbi:MAG: acyl-CoA dehydrogenase, partial [Methyloceanibacter sp.]
MSTPGETLADSKANLMKTLESVAAAAGALRDRAIEAVKAKVMVDGKIDGAALEREQHAVHGLAWIATYVEALRQIADYARRMEDEGRFGEMEALLAQIGAAEYAAQLHGGVMMSQGEMVRPHELGVAETDRAAFMTPEVRSLI